MVSLKLIAQGLILLCAFVAPISWAQTTPEARCTALASIDFSGLPDASTQITKTEIIRIAADLPESCQVHGFIDKTVGFAIAMPLDGWNGKFFQTGCGGACGTTRLFFCDEPLNRGYACLATDMGHKGAIGDWSWAVDNLQAVANFGFRSTHMAAVTGKAIVEAYYSNAPKHSYFYGCSTGGRQAMVEAQHFPWDFDGIIVGAPAIDETGAAIQLLWTVMANRDKDGNEILKEADVRALHVAVMQQCDANDNLIDGLIGDPRQCKFDPVQLRCTTPNSEKCLTPEKIDVARKFYGGPKTSDGKKLYPGGLMRGSELAWLGAFVSGNGKAPLYFSFITNFWQHIGFARPPGSAWKPEQFDFDKDYKRVGMMEPLFTGSSPDLRKFKARGGKLIGFQGWNDDSIEPMNFLDYYQTTAKTMGGLEKTTDFFRLFMVPGMRHCSSDGVGADAINYIEYLENWVEKGQPPNVMIGQHLMRDAPVTRSLTFPLPANKVDFSRPHYPYPAQYRYKGAGDPRDAASFSKVNVKETF